MYYSLRDQNNTIIDHGTDLQCLLLRNYNPDSDDQPSLYKQEQLNPSSIVKLCDLEKAIMPNNDVPIYDKIALYFGVVNTHVRFKIATDNICWINFGDGYQTLLKQGEHDVFHEYKNAYQMHHVQVSFGVRGFAMYDESICYFKMCRDSVLKKLNLEHVYMNHIDLLGNSLKDCDIQHCNLVSMTVDCPNLNNLHVNNNFLKKLEFIKDTNLLVLNCSYNCLSSISLMHCVSIHSLYCSDNQFKKLTIASPTLERLDCSSNQLESISLFRANNLKYIECSENCLTHLNLGSAGQLKTLICNYNNLTTIEGFCAFIEQLQIKQNKLTVLDLSKASYLQKLDCSDNCLQSLDLSNCLNLKDVDCCFNKITDIKLSNKLKKINLSHNRVNELVANKHMTELQYLYCTCNNLTRLDVSMCKSLICVHAEYNPLEEIKHACNIEVKTDY